MNKTVLQCPADRDQADQGQIGSAKIDSSQDAFAGCHARFQECVQDH